MKSMISIEVRMHIPHFAKMPEASRLSDQWWFPSSLATVISKQENSGRMKRNVIHTPSLIHSLPPTLPHHIPSHPIMPPILHIHTYVCIRTYYLPTRILYHAHWLIYCLSQANSFTTYYLLTSSRWLSTVSFVLSLLACNCTNILATHHQTTTSHLS